VEDGVGRVRQYVGLAALAHQRVTAQIIHRRSGDGRARPERVDADAAGKFPRHAQHHQAHSYFARL
jgi:hypothetical protein